MEARCVEALAPVLSCALNNPRGHEGIGAIDDSFCHAVLSVAYARAGGGPAEVGFPPPVCVASRSFSDTNQRLSQAPHPATDEVLVGGETLDEEESGRERAGVVGADVERHAAGVMHQACIPVASLLADLVRPNVTGLVCPNATDPTAPEGVVFFSPHPCNPPDMRGGGACRAATDDVKDDAGGGAASLVQAVRAAVLFLQRVHAPADAVHGEE